MGVPAPPIPGAGLAPPMVFAEAVKVAQKKAQMPPHVTAVLGFSAGAMIGVGALLMTAVGGASPALFESDPGLDAFLKGAVGLPFGLTMVVLTGAELFTSNIFTMLAGVMTGKVKPRALATNWVLSYFTNLIGSVCMAWLAHEANTLFTPPQVKAAKGIAMMKVGLPFGTAVAKGILCNWLVCLAVWGALSSPSIAGKILAIFWPISAFVTLGFEHCVANMFLIPMGVFVGADITPVQFIFNNIVPVTIGNIIGAAVFVTGIHYVAYQDAAVPEMAGDETEEEYSSDDKMVLTSGKARQTRGIVLETEESRLQQEQASQPLMESHHSQPVSPQAFANPGYAPQVAPMEMQGQMPGQFGYGGYGPPMGQMPMGMPPMGMPTPRYM